MIKLNSHSVSADCLKDLENLFITGNFVQGKYVEEFENKIKSTTGYAHCVAVSSGTAALDIAYRIIMMEDRSDFLVPHYTYPATANVALAQGAHISLGAVDPMTYLISNSTYFEWLKNGKPSNKCFIPVNQFGNIYDDHSVLSSCEEESIPIIIDGACSMGHLNQYYKHYSMIKAVTLSFHPRKIISTGGEGGAILTNDTLFADKARVIRNHGFNGSEFTMPGLNYRMTEMQAVIGLHSLKEYNSTKGSRKTAVKKYSELLASEIASKRIVFPTFHPNASWQSLVIRVKPFIRNQLITYLRNNSISASIGSWSLLNIEYASSCNLYCMPNIEDWSSETVAIPLDAEMNDETINIVSHQIKSFLSSCESSNS